MCGGKLRNIFSTLMYKGEIFARFVVALLVIIVFGDLLLQKKPNEIFTKSVIDQIQKSIEGNQGNEVFFTGYVDAESGMVIEVEAVVFGNENMTPVFVEKAVASDVVIHNHPSGVLKPSPQDLQMADLLMNQSGVSFLIVDNPVKRVKAVFYAPDLKGKERNLLDEKNILSLFSEKGQVAQNFPGFEIRESQQTMISKIIEAYNQDGIALIEAGTGTGKSLAYLIPSIFWALENKEKVVISTYTKNLQHQLMEKDLPLLEKILDKKFKYAIIKGKGNYLCKKRFIENHKNIKSADGDLFEEEHEKSLQLFLQVEEWIHQTEEGDLEELPPEVTRGVGEDLRASSDLCAHRKCPFFYNCFVNQAKQEVFTSDIIIANHHYLLGQLSLDYNEVPSRILPQFSRVVIDEAHNFKKAAYSYLENEASYFGILKNINRIYSIGRKKRMGDLNILNNLILQEYPENSGALSELIEQDIAPLIPQIKSKMELFFPNLFDLIEEKIHEKESTYRIKDEGHQDFMPLKPAFDEVLSSVRYLFSHLDQLHKKIKKLPESFREDHELLLRSWFRRGELLLSQVELYELIFSKVYSGNAVWLEIQKSKKNTSLHQSNLETEYFFRKTLYQDHFSLVFTSATLAINHQFAAVKNDLAMEIQKPIFEAILDSPFDYSKQSLVLIPSDIPAPFGADRDTTPFIQKSLYFINQAIQNSEGGVFVLCTSFTQIRLVKKHLEDQGCDYPLLIQGEANRRDLVERFKQIGNAVLLGTDSFWEGVDIQGQALRCVIIFKLPFRPPNDPVTETLYELAEKQGDNPFMKIAVPEAVIKFKQGFGRLIRSKSDKGCIAILDRRLIGKAYGRIFLGSLPVEKRKMFHDKSDVLLDLIPRFLAYQG